MATAPPSPEGDKNNNGGCSTLAHHARAGILRRHHLYLKEIYYRPLADALGLSNTQIGLMMSAFDIPCRYIRPHLLEPAHAFCCPQ